jgi:hypothetical protein
MSKEKFASIMRDDPQPERTQEPSTLAKILEGAKDMGGAIWDGAARHVEHGSAELSSALFNGTSYVPYGWSRSDSSQEQTIEPAKTPEATQEQDRVGREM